ncbi:hypothetical protein [Sigmofec virus UA08Rod_5746]|uniref:Uncharacterized protein n=1 Tax=Sigmofec virus UA08Rod_5746 TaxID=2929439 RepID=A0A976N1Z2_9VIRU|nr:hypothetical protein [Sigmofec virus UA08Rod_5746]
MSDKSSYFDSLYSDKIYLNRSRSDYIRLLKFACAHFCSNVCDDVRDDLCVTPFTYSELMKFIRLNLERNLNSLILDESEIK